MTCPPLATALLVVLSLCCSCTVAFSLPAASHQCSRIPRVNIGGCRIVLPSRDRYQTHTLSSINALHLVFPLRGGDDEVSEVSAEDSVGGGIDSSSGGGSSQEAVIADDTSSVASTKGTSATSFASLAPIAAFLQSAGCAYSNLLNTRPILTKSITASLIFGLSDFSAQQIESGGKVKDGNTKSKDWIRTITASLVGLLYFGPAAHSWYETIFKILPGTSLVSTLQKAALGQLLFGPSFTCVFFATSLMQSGTFSLSNWFTKIRQDLPGAWVAGLSFWPMVDLVSYSLIPAKWIPLFVNFCSFVWTIYLSIVANRRC